MKNQKASREVAHICNLSAWGVEAVRLGAQGVFQVEVYLVYQRPCLRQPTNQTQAETAETLQPPTAAHPQKAHHRLSISNLTSSLFCFFHQTQYVSKALGSTPSTAEEKQILSQASHARFTLADLWLFVESVYVCSCEGGVLYHRHCLEVWGLDNTKRN